MTLVAFGTPTPGQSPGDCVQQVCDGDGGTTAVPDEQDPPDGGSACFTGACVDGGPTEVVNVGAVCGSSLGAPLLCDAHGACGCQSDADCSQPYETCGGGGISGVCGCTPARCATLSPPATCGSVPNGCGGTLNCNDGTRNGNETDVDCGGGASGTCSTLCGTGKKCTAGTDCQSGFCVDGVCCSTACTNGCTACSTAKKGQGADGTCGPVKAGLADPKGTCSSQPASSCGQTGVCNGAGQCSTWANGTTCQAAFCRDATTQVRAETCLAGGCAAPTPATLSCTPYLCSGTGCLTQCQGDADCAPGYTCSNHSCVP